MTLDKIYAQLSCSDLTKSSKWFQKLFGRPYDLSPMEGLHEWYHGSQAGFQLFLNKTCTGKGTLTLIVSNLISDKANLTERGLEVGEIEKGDVVSIIRLSDPDGNLIVLAEPKSD